jgi:hypothetical protein
MAMAGGSPWVSTAKLPYVYSSSEELGMRSEERGFENEERGGKISEC